MAALGWSGCCNYKIMVVRQPLLLFHEVKLNTLEIYGKMEIFHRKIGIEKDQMEILELNNRVFSGWPY